MMTHRMAFPTPEVPKERLSFGDFVADERMKRRDRQLLQ